MPMRRAAISLLFLLAACDWADKSQAEEKVRRELLDPDSARFRDVAVFVHPDQSRTVCGQVNSKNRMGGYVGYVGFVVEGDKVVLEPAEPITAPESGSTDSLVMTAANLAYSTAALRCVNL